MSALIKLLDDVSQYESDRGRQAAKLRQVVFRAAAPSHPLTAISSGVFSNEQWVVKRKIAGLVGKPWPEIERLLYSDVIEFHPLKCFTGYENGTALLARYNVAQVQACLYRATRMTLWANADLQTIIRAIKLSRLMHQVRRFDNGEIQFVLSGPASIEAKLKTLHQFAHEPIWIIAQSDRQYDLSGLPALMLKSILFYKTKISLSELAERLRAISDP